MTDEDWITLEGLWAGRLPIHPNVAQRIREAHDRTCPK